MRLQLLAFIVFLSSVHLSYAVPVEKPPVVRTGASAFSRDPAIPKWADALESIPSTQSEEPVVIRLAETQYWTGANPAYLVNRATQVNSSSRLAEIGQFSITFIPAYQKLILHRVAILRGNEVLDRTRTANIRVLDNENDAGKGYYLGESKAQLLLEDVKAGDTLWIIYTVEGTNPVFGSTWNEHLPWPKQSPIELRKVSVLQPVGHQVQWGIVGDTQSGLAQPTVEQRNGMTKLVFKQSAVPATEYEPSTPPDLVPIPVLDFSEYKNWNQVALWANALFSGTAPSAEMQALARKFTADTLEERASQALHWVQDDIRYFSVSMGENSHRPQPPEMVLKRRFGDCKDKTQLLVALYHAMGIEAQPVLLHALSPKLPAQFLPSPGSFNHAIVRLVLDGKTYFVDPTQEDERGLISTLPVPVPSAAALVVSNDSTGLINLPEEKLDEPLVDRSEQLTVGSLHGDAQLYLRLTYRGRFTASMRRGYRALSSAEIKKALLGQYERTYPGVTLDGGVTLSDGDGGASFLVEAKLLVPKVLKEKDGALTLAQRSHIMEGTLGIPDKLVRKWPFWFSAGHYRARYSLDASLPAEARLMKDDSLLTVQNSHFDARAQLTWRGAHLNYYIDYAINTPEVAPAALPGLAEQVRKLDQMFESDFRFKPVIVAPQAANEASLRVLDILQKLSIYDDLLQEVLVTGKAPELKWDESVYQNLNYRALCASVVDSYTVRDWSPLLGMVVSPYYKVMHERADARTKELCGARFFFIQHSLVDASTALEKLKPDDDDALTLMQAWADFHAHQPARARINLLRFLKSKGESKTLDADEAVFALALARRMGMAEPPEITRLASSLRQDAWPVPLFDRLRGKLSDAQVQAAIDAMPPVAREYAHLEAHFYLSQAHLAENERRKADPHLNWLARYSLLGSPFEVLANDDQYSDERADADMQQIWKIEGKSGSASDIVQHLTAAAARGITSAQRSLGWRYMKGDGVTADAAKGLPLLEAAAAKGDANAMNLLGRVYALGMLVTIDKTRAVSYYRRATENGDPYAAYNLGRGYWFGDLGLPVDLEQSFRYMRDAAEMRNSSAEFYLSRMYFEGRGVEKNDSLALFWASQGYYQDDVEDKAQLGLLLLNLRTDKVGHDLGLKLLLEAANGGTNYAQLEYGRLVLKGPRTDAEKEIAFDWVSKAAIGGNETAKALLGTHVYRRNGRQCGPAARLGIIDGAGKKKRLPDAYTELGNVYRSKTSGMTDKAKAAEYFRRGVEFGAARGSRVAGRDAAYWRRHPAGSAAGDTLL